MPAVKLDPAILDSSLWLDLPARSVFLTALLMARPITTTEPMAGIEPRSFEDSGFTVPPGDYGFVEAVGGAIITKSHIEREQGWVALDALCAPDPQTTLLKHQGRLMQRVEGGYIILNYDRFYAFVDKKKKKERQDKWLGKVRSNKQPAQPEKKKPQKTTYSSVAIKPSTEDFSIFWEAYPRKTSKATALKSWLKIRPDAALLDVILAAVEAQSKSPQWVKDDGQFIPHPATWLNQRRWEDKPVGAPKASVDIQASWRTPAPEPDDLPFTAPFEDL
jgi:hypothetical protein